MENIKLLKIQLYILEHDIKKQQERLHFLQKEKERLLSKINDSKNSSNK